MTDQAPQVSVLIPVLRRPHRMAPTVASLIESNCDALLHPYFIVSSSDKREIAAFRKAGEARADTDPPLTMLLADWKPGPGDYARKMNLGVAGSKEEWIFLAADDLRFAHGWADEAISVATRTGKRVVGTNDMGNPWVKRGRHSTHTLVHRSYVTEGTADEPGVLLHEGYDHNWVDVEMIETASVRREFVFAPRSIVEHMHPNWGKGDDDATYRKGMAHFHDDRRLLDARRHLWSPRSALRQRHRMV